MFAIVWAFFEVQTEGSISWAGILPCLRHKSSPESKETTAFHILLGTLFIMAFELFYAVKFKQWISLEDWLDFLPWMLITINLEDYLWNVINPSELYGWRQTFIEERFPAMFGIFIKHIPLDYYIFTGSASIIFLWRGGNIWYWLVVILSCFLTAVLFTIFMPYVHKRFPWWGESLKKYNKDHNFFLGENVTAYSDVTFSDGREGYKTDVSGISTIGRINSRSLEELKNI